MLREQTVVFSPDGMTSGPAKSALAAASQVAASMRTPAETESVGTGASVIRNAQVPKSVGTVKVNLSFDN